MSHRRPPTDNPDAGRYEIRLAGHLGARWSAWFDGLTVTHTANGETILAGPVEDQAALHGLLIKVRDLHLPLLAVRRFGPEPNDSDTRPNDR